MTNSIATTPKFCRDCKFLTLSKCTHPESISYDLVTGKEIITDAFKMHTDPFNTRCGYGAVLFRPRHDKQKASA